MISLFYEKITFLDNKLYRLFCVPISIFCDFSICYFYLFYSKIAQGNGLPTEMRNYADELIKKYMTSLAPNAE